MKTYKWTSRAISDYYYDEETGQVVGSINRHTFSDDVYSATVNSNYIGDYIEKKSAMKAVEKRIQDNDANDIRLGMPVTEDFDPRSKSPLTPMWESNNNSMLGENH